MAGEVSKVARTWLRRSVQFECRSGVQHHRPPGCRRGEIRSPARVLGLSRSRVHSPDLIRCADQGVGGDPGRDPIHSLCLAESRDPWGWEPDLSREARGAGQPGCGTNKTTVPPTTGGRYIDPP